VLISVVKLLSLVKYLASLNTHTLKLHCGKVTLSNDVNNIPRTEQIQIQPM